MTKKEKIEKLIDETRRQMPNATETDFAKATPTGRAISKVIDQVSRNMFSKTQDKEWIAAGKHIVRRITGKMTKPAKLLEFETK